MATRNLTRMDRVFTDAALTIISGDLTNFGGAADAQCVIDEVRRYCPKVLAVPGNLDRADVFERLESENINLHGRGVVWDGIGIFGCGGSNLTPFNTPSEFSEEEIYSTLQRAYDEVRGCEALLMICHPPPFATNCDRLLSGKSVGSPAARRFIEEVQPAVCISGHIHESAGVDRIGATTIVNAGPFKGGGYVVVSRIDSRLQAELEFL
jgi:uncharacterized protein